MSLPVSYDTQMTTMTFNKVDSFRGLSLFRNNSFVPYVCWLYLTMEKVFTNGTNDNDDCASSASSSQSKESSTSAVHPVQMWLDESHCEAVSELDAELEEELNRQMEEMLQEQDELIENEIQRQLDEALERQLNEQMEAYLQDHLQNDLESPPEEERQQNILRDLLRLSVVRRPSVESINASIQAAIDNYNAREKSG